MSGKEGKSQDKRAKSSLDVESIVSDLKQIGVPFEDAEGLKEAKPASGIISGIYSPKIGRYPMTRLNGGANGADSIALPIVEDASYFDDIDEQMAKAIRTYGTDALAWYCPFHRFARNSWGIYIPDVSVSYLALKVFNDPQTKLPRRAAADSISYALAFRLLFLHEFFHFVTEVSASTIEFIKAAPCYEYYFAHEYCMPIDYDEPIEEALANAFAFPRTLKEIEKLPNSRAWQKDAFGKTNAFMSHQPSGYSSFPEYVGSDEFFAGAGRLAAMIDQRSRPRKESQLLALLFDCDQRHVFYEDVPVHLVRTIARSDVSREIDIPMPSTRKLESED